MRNTQKAAYQGLTKEEIGFGSFIKAMVLEQQVFLRQ